jgi:hypothetical protein
VRRVGGIEHCSRWKPDALKGLYYVALGSDCEEPLRLTLQMIDREGDGTP